MGTGTYQVVIEVIEMSISRFGVLQFGSASTYSQELSSAILSMEEVINTTRYSHELRSSIPVLSMEEVINTARYSHELS
jgi:hypothetical protein